MLKPTTVLVAAALAAAAAPALANDSTAAWRPADSFSCAMTSSRCARRTHTPDEDIAVLILKRLPPQPPAQRQPAPSQQQPKKK